MATNSMKGTQAFQDTIAQYLMARAEQDPMFAVRLANPSKTMAQCCAYIIGEVKKSGCCGFTDDEIFGWAMHFWDEPEIEVREFRRLYIGHLWCAVLVESGHCAYLPGLVVAGDKHFFLIQVFCHNKKVFGVRNLRRFRRDNYCV